MLVSGLFVSTLAEVASVTDVADVVIALPELKSDTLKLVESSEKVDDTPEVRLKSSDIEVVLDIVTVEESDVDITEFGNAPAGVLDVYFCVFIKLGTIQEDTKVEDDMTSPDMLEVITANVLDDTTELGGGAPSVLDAYPGVLVELDTIQEDVAGGDDNMFSDVLAKIIAESLDVVSPGMDVDDETRYVYPIGEDSDALSTVISWLEIAYAYEEDVTLVIIDVLAV